MVLLVYISCSRPHAKMRNLFVFCLFYTGLVQCNGGSCATDDEGCFSYTFHLIEDLKNELTDDTKLREYIRQQVEQQEAGNGEKPLCQEPEQITETTTRAISTSVTERSSTTTDTANISPDIDRRDSTTKITSQFIFETSTPPLTTSVESQTASVAVSASTETAVSTETSEKINDCEMTSNEAQPSIEELDKQICVSYDSDMSNWDSTNSSCFYFIKQPDRKATYAEAKSNCTNIGGKLVAKGIRDGTIKAYLSNPDLYFNTCNCKRFWIGLQYSEESWKWSDNCTSNEDGANPWKDFKQKSNNQCVLIKRNDYDTRLDINDHDCNKQERYICEK